jgi:uncharacterized protein
MKKIPLEIIGLSYSQSQSGAYALIIGETTGPRRLPIIIGNAEAQAIALELENFKTQRPLTHDLFYNFAKTFQIELIEIIISKFSEGIFFSLLICKQGDTVIEIDARTSDAVALALRFKCPMYAYEEILDAAGIIINEETSESPDESDQDSDEADDITPEDLADAWSKLNSYTLKQLQSLLSSAIDSEEFEKASVIRDEIKNRTKVQK